MEQAPAAQPFPGFPKHKDLGVGGGIMCGLAPVISPGQYAARTYQQGADRDFSPDVGFFRQQEGLPHVIFVILHAPQTSRNLSRLYAAHIHLPTTGKNSKVKIT
jgi:hypothetical protein